MAELTFQICVVLVSVKLILTNWSANWQIWIGMTCTMQWWCHMKEMFNDCPTLSTYLLLDYFETMSVPSPSSHHSLCLFSHPFHWQSSRVHYPHHCSLFPLSVLTGPNMCPPYFSHLCLLLKEKRQEKEAVLDYCEQSWYFHGGRVGERTRTEPLPPQKVLFTCDLEKWEQMSEKLLHRVQEIARNGCK